MITLFSKLLTAMMLLSMMMFGSGCTGLMEDFMNIDKGSEDSPSEDPSPAPSTTSSRMQVTPGMMRSPGATYSTEVKAQYNSNHAAGSTYSVKMSISGQAQPDL